jgi:Uma2 family endonuclease
MVARADEGVGDYIWRMNYATDSNMNTHFRPPGTPISTRAAEGLERRVWTVAEIEAMVAAGIIDEDERFELIDGEVVPMSPKGTRHEVLKGSLNDWWVRHLPRAYRLIPETTLRLDAKNFLEPDFVFFDAATGVAGIKAENLLLAVEVADSSLRYDTGRKAQIYAARGVRELWAIDADKLVTHVFSRPSPEGYLERRVVEPHELLAPAFAPEISVKLAELPMI